MIERLESWSSLGERRDAALLGVALLTPVWALLHLSFWGTTKSPRPLPWALPLEPRWERDPKPPL